ncbi:MAG TPA: MmgE/PrpD family protein [Actinomycetota bacterium]
MGSISQTLAGSVAGLRYDDLPRDVVTAAKRHLLDAVGVAVAAADTGVCDPIIEMIRSWSGAREASVLGYDLGAPAPMAALANGALAHALEYDDTHVASVVSPSAVIMPAAFAVAEEAGTDGRALLTAAVAGYEVAARIGGAAPGRFQARGLHTTGVAGPFAAAATAARLWGLSADETAAAFGLAGDRSGGTLASLGQGGEAEPMHTAWAAHDGVLAADLARRGVAGATTIFEGPRGLFDALLAGEESDLEHLTEGLGERWETTRIALKPYPACHFLHAHMDAAARLKLKWADIEEIICSLPPAAVDIVAEPRAARLHPSSLHAAQFSLPFAVAAVVVGGREGVELFGDEARADRRVLSLAERVVGVPDPTLPFPHAYGGRLTVHTRSGRTLTIDEEINRGHPDRPLSEQELADKFVANVKGRFGVKTARKLLTRLRCLDEVRDVEQLMASFRLG